MAVLVAVLGNLLLLLAQASAECSSNQCESMLTSDNCLNLGGYEEVDCYTYTCEYDGGAGHGILVKDSNQRQRCQINGACYGVGEGPNSCSFCAEDANGVVTPILGCKRKEKCHAVQSLFEEGCEIRTCAFENNALSTQVVSTLGCEFRKDCLNEGEKFRDLTCNECKLDEDTRKHSWHRECHDWTIGQCFPKGAVHNIYCNTFICGNRGGFGWYPHQGDACAISPDYCLDYNATAVRDDFCYVCETTDGGPPTVTCKSDCGDCVKEGQSVQCNGNTFTCGNVDDPPTEDEIECSINGVTIKVDERTTFQCNSYLCTLNGLVQETLYCEYQGACYDPYEIIDSDKCIRCNTDGAESEVEQGCSYNGDCYSTGAIIRSGCKNKICKKVGGDLIFQQTEYQPTPCSCFGECYPVGTFVYGDNRLCVECKADGSITYACRLSNGDCLKAGEEETIPSSGCYRVRCNYLPEGGFYSLSKAPGQPFQCYNPGGECINEGDTYTVNGESRVCHSGECTFMGNDIKVGDAYRYKCHDIGCKVVVSGDTKTFVPFIQKYACEYGDSCLEVDKEYEKDCDIYKCGVATDPLALAREVLVRRRCSCDGSCMEVGETYWSTHCTLRKCQDNFQMENIEKGCKSQLLDTCIKMNQTITVNGQTETCSEATDTDTGSGGGDNEAYVCTFGPETVPYGSTITMNCNTMTCEKRNNVIGLHINGDPKCYDGESCLAQGEVKHCFMCKFDAAMEFPIFERIGCEDDGGNCVAPGGNLVRNCENFMCDNTFNLQPVSRTQCRVANTCISEGQTEVVTYQSIDYTCTCNDAAANSHSCTR